MARSPSHGEEIGGGVKKGPWTPEEDRKLIEYVQKHGGGSWQRLPKLAGLNRCGKSCRLRWTNYLRPDIKRGRFTDEEEALIIHLHSLLGNKWSSIATRLPGRTDNEIKNYWNTHLRKKLLRKGIDPVTHRPTTTNNSLAFLASFLSSSSSALNLTNTTTTSSGGGGGVGHLDIGTIGDLKLRADAAHLAKLQLFQSTILQAFPTMELMNLLLLTATADDLLLKLQNSVLFPGTSDLSSLGQQHLNKELMKPMDEGEAVMNIATTSSFPASNSTAPFNDSISSPDLKINNVDFTKSSDPLPSASVEGNWDHNPNSLDNLLNDPLLKEILEQIQ